MAKRKPLPSPTSAELADQSNEFHSVFALNNVTQLRHAVEQAVFGEIDSPTQVDNPDRAHTVEVLTTLGQMGELTEMDLDEAKKGYLK